MLSFAVFHRLMNSVALTLLLIIFLTNLFLFVIIMIIDKKTNGTFIIYTGKLNQNLKKNKHVHSSLIQSKF